MFGKDIWQSKTFWFNILALIVAVAVRFGYGEFQPAAGVGAAAAVIAAVLPIVYPVINIGLRLVTKEPIVLHRRRR